MRGPQGGRRVIDLETSDAGALFRFADIYSRMDGGQMTTVMDPPSASNPIQAGRLNVRNFAVHDEIQLEHAVSNGSRAAAQQHVFLWHEGRFHPHARTDRAA